MRGPTYDFSDLMRHRIEEILLVASPYDAFVLEEGGRLSELMLRDSAEPPPRVTSVSTGVDALARLAEGGRFQLVLTTIRVADMNAAELARRAREAGSDVPFVLLAFDARDLDDFRRRHGPALASDFAGVFRWQGDGRLLPAIVKLLEDRRNVEHDVASAGVQVILLIEDSVRYYSSFLPVIYDELLTQSQRLIAEGLNLAHRLMRLRARPKILLCRSTEEAWEAFTSFADEVLGIVSDVDFPREGVRTREAGVDFARAVRERAPDVPVVLQSSRPEYAKRAREAGASFLVKGSPTLLHDLRHVMTEYFGFGDFVFRRPDGTEVGRARDLGDLEQKLRTVPAESLAYHGESNHFSKWLKARTEFQLAALLRPRKLSDFATPEDIRTLLLGAIADYRRVRRQGIVADFDSRSFDDSSGLSRIGGGSLGGKARGLAFARRLLLQDGLESKFAGLEIVVPPAVVLGTDVFDRFLEENGLRSLALNAKSDDEVRRAFAAAPFPSDVRRDLLAFVARMTRPLAVRSSSLLEDSQYQPFTGVYDTIMLDNAAKEPEVRLHRLAAAVRRVWASTFSQATRRYLTATPYRLEEEKMAVILQPIVGAAHGARFYPEVAGVARSHDYYPLAPQKAEDGVVAAALGLGRTVVEGGACVRFCPRAPRRTPPFSSAADVLDNAQRTFWTLKLDGSGEELCELTAAEEDGTLAAVGSTWSADNDAISDGLSRAGVRFVSLAPLLKHDLVPLAPALDALLGAGEAGMGTAVEIEFALNLSVPAGARAQLGFLQLRPLTLSREWEALEPGDVSPARLVCRSASVMGNGRLGEIRDVVVVDVHRFERGRSLEAAAEVTRLNAGLTTEGRSYVLIGVGRWGSRDPWLGIPVTWDQISGARAIVEAGFKDFRVTPSQGSHFFQNLSSFRVGYFTVNPDAGEGFVDWDWLAAQPAVSEAGHVRHLRFSAPLTVVMSGRKGEGVIFKPGEG